jgi:uncharacterized hydrophobic protein (TIGR00271 family)
MAGPSPVPDPRPESSSFFGWLTEHLSEGVDHRLVVEKVREDAGWDPHFAFMTLMSAGIAVLGLLLSSPAVVIGAMLISPLMGPIIGLGFALATFDHAELRRTASALAVGAAMAVIFCVAVVLLSPLQTLTAEIAARTRPNLFDLLVALFSGLAGTYSMIRGRHGTITGVAIATALMPPLAVMGFGLATGNWTVLAGSSLLFFTNLMIIAAAAAILARLYGFAADLSPHQTRLQATLIVGIMIGFAVPLALALKQIAWEALAAREIRAAFAETFGDGARLSELDVDFDADPIAVTATVLTPRVRRGAEGILSERLGQLLAHPVELGIDQLRIDNQEAEAAELAGARGVSAQRAESRIADRLALIAGVGADQVLLDRTRRRALVRAAPLPGAGLATYRALEQRAAEAADGWTLLVVPPLTPLPAIAFDGDGPSAEGAAALEAAIWGASRLRLPVAVGAADPERAELVAQAMREAGVQVTVEERGEGDTVQLRWATGAPPAP